MPKPKTPPTEPSPENPETDLMAPHAILERRVKLNDTSLTFSDDTTFEEWQEVYGFCDKLNERGKWWLGDVIHYAEGKFADRYTQAIEMTGLSYSRLTTIVSICGRIEPKRRRAEASFSFHEMIAYLPYQTGDHLLDRAIKEKWTSEQLADSVARAKGEPTKAEKRAAKDAAKVKSLPGTAKTLDGHITVETQQTPLYWNGYVLTTRERRVYMGNTRLSPAEAENAAHFNKLAHAEALVNWLEEHGFTRKETDGLNSPNLPEVRPSVPEIDQRPAEGVQALQNAQPTATEPASTASASKPDIKQWEEFFGNHPAILQRRSMEEAWRIMVDDLAQAIAERDDARNQLSLAKHQLEAMHPEELAEHHITSFNEIIPKVDWAALKALTLKKWQGNLLRPVDELIDLLDRIKTSR